MVVGALVLWIGVPAAVLWALGRVIGDRTEHLIAALLAVPLAMALFGLLLAMLNTAYLRVTGVPIPPSEDEDGWTPRLRGPLDPIIRVSAAISLIALLAWLLLGSEGVAPVGP